MTMVKAMVGWVKNEGRAGLAVEGMVLSAFYINQAELVVGE